MFGRSLIKELSQMGAGARILLGRGTGALFLMKESAFVYEKKSSYAREKVTLGQTFISDPEVTGEADIFRPGSDNWHLC
jgi:hypothetical protein